MFTYKWPRPALTSDIVVIRFNHKNRVSRELNQNISEVLLIERNVEPLGWALPGGHCNEGETTVQCAARELFEETGLTVDQKSLRMLSLFDDPNRDPRGWVISAAYYTYVPHDSNVKAGDDASSYKWVNIQSINNEQDIAFDHKDIINFYIANVMMTLY